MGILQDFILFLVFLSVVLAVDNFILLSLLIISYFLIFPVLGINSSVKHMLDKCSAMELHPQHQLFFLKSFLICFLFINFIIY
jgi:diacylglycerol kinase